jgi:dual specificity protein kinase YAK1
MYHSPLGPSGFNLHSQAGGTFLGSSPDIRRRSYLYHGGGIRLSPGCPGPMSLGASPSQFTPPSSQMQIPSTATGKYGSTSPARSSHGSLGKAAAVGQYNRRRNLGHPPISMPPHEYTSQLIQGHHGDGTISNHFDGYARGHSGYPQSALPNPGHFSWRPHTCAGSGLSTDTSNHGSFPPSRYGGFHPSHSSNVSADTLASTSSIPDPADWDPNYR